MSNPYATDSPYSDPNYGQPNHGEPVRPVLAHWGLRLGSGVIDWLIIGIPALIVDQVTGSNLIGFPIEIALLLFVSYQEGTTGQSPGKKVVGTRVLREADGQLLGFGSAVARRLLHILDMLPCYVGFLWPLWDEKKQCFADKTIHSVVIRSN